MKPVSNAWKDGALLILLALSQAILYFNGSSYEPVTFRSGEPFMKN